jgi:hypothetical protein
MRLSRRDPDAEERFASIVHELEYAKRWMMYGDVEMRGTGVAINVLPYGWMNFKDLSIRS